jgi:hypothetical protein
MTSGKIVGIGAAAFFLFVAFWLLSPFIKIEPSDYMSASKLALRFAFGILILLIYSGKWAFDVFAPQGLAKRVSGVKTAGLIIFNLIVVCYIIFIVFQAASLFLQWGVNQDEANF